MIAKFFHRVWFTALLVIVLTGTTAWQTSEPATAPAPGPGAWEGTTSEGRPMSFTVSPSGTQVSDFALQTHFVATDCYNVGVTLTIGVPGPKSISNNQFSHSSSNYSFSGHFNSATTASGTFAFTNYQIVISLPYPPYVCFDYMTKSGTWNASVPITISGNAGASAATLSYVNSGPQTVTADGSGNYSITIPAGWSGTVTPSKPGYTFTPANRTYSNITASQTGQNYTAIVSPFTISGSTGVGGVRLSYIDGTAKTVTSQTNGSYSIQVPPGWSGAVTPSHACYTFVPATRTYSNVTSNQTMQNYTQTIKPSCANLSVTIGGIDQGHFALPPQNGTRASFTGVNNGPVKVFSTNGVPLIAAERVVYKVNNINTSFTEMMGLPNHQLDSVYWLPWYNNVELDTQLRFANVSSSTANVRVYIGGAEMSGSPFTLLAGQSTRKSFAGINDGPVKIESTEHIIAAERVVYKVNSLNTSFSEMMAQPNKQLDTIYWLPWYNNTELDTQLRFANVSISPATVHVYIGGEEMTGSPFTLAVGESTRKSFPGVNDGPVKIESNVNIVAAERVVYKVNNINTSFTEMMGLPNSQLDTSYWLPWYNNKELDTQLRFANVSNSTATVHVYIGGAEMSGSPFTLAAGTSTRQSFVNINNGPVQIVSNVPIVAAERLVYKVNNIPTSFSEMMGLPDGQMDTLYWLPWYNNVELDTQLRFGTP